MHAPKPNADGYEIVVVDIQKHTLRTVTSLAGSSYFPSWTKDGRLSFRYDGEDYRGFMMIENVLGANADKAKALVARLARDFPREHEPCPIGSDRALDTALITAPEARDKKLLKKLDAVAGRVLKTKR